MYADMEIKNKSFSLLDKRLNYPNQTKSIKIFTSLILLNLRFNLRSGIWFSRLTTCWVCSLSTSSCLLPFPASKLHTLLSVSFSSYLPKFTLTSFQLFRTTHLTLCLLMLWVVIPRVPKVQNFPDSRSLDTKTFQIKIMIPIYTMYVSSCIQVRFANKISWLR